jgi:hypothetical protein
MPINRLLKGSNLTAAEIETLNRAFDLALKKLGLVDRNDLIAEMVAEKIVAVAKRGLREPHRNLGHRAQRAAALARTR